MTNINISHTSEEFPAKSKHHSAGLLFLLIVLNLVFLVAFVIGIVLMAEEKIISGALLMTLGIAFGFVVIPILYLGFRIVKPNEAMVLTLFGRYIGTVRGEGFYFVNPFSVSVAPAEQTATTAATASKTTIGVKGDEININLSRRKNRLSMKAMTLSNDKQKINDLLGNPIIIGIVVIWRVTDSYKAVFNVENYFDFLSIQCDSALRNIVRLYPYDAKDDGESNEKSLRGSSLEIAQRLCDEIQSKVEIAGIEITEARITHLAYAPEIAAAMLQRQQASAVVDARQLIVEGAVGMVEMALEKLSEHDIVSLDEERKAAMVSNLLVVLCGNRDAQPVVNSGSLY